MVTDPYDDDDDQPTLQRLPSGIAKSASGVRTAFAVPVSIGAPLDHGFGEETTAVDHVALAANDETEAVPAPPAAMTPADGEQPTPALPLDVAEFLLRLSGDTERPPPADPDR